MYYMPAVGACVSASCCRRHPRACTSGWWAPGVSSIDRSHARGRHQHQHHPEVNTTLQAAGPAAQTLRGLAIDGAIAISHTTAANLDFARNWYLHLQRAGVRNYALIATDEAAHVALAAEIAGHVVECPRTVFRAKDTTAAQAYRSRGWTRLMFAVPRMLRWVLGMGHADRRLKPADGAPRTLQLTRLDPAPAQP